MSKLLFAFDADDPVADATVAAAASAAAAASVRAAASVPLRFRWRRFRPGKLQTLAGGEGDSLPCSLPSIQSVYLVGEPGSLPALLWRFPARRNSSESFTSRLLSSATSVLAPRCGDRCASFLRRSPWPCFRSTPTFDVVLALPGSSLIALRAGATSNFFATVSAIRFCSRRSSTMVASITAALSVISSAELACGALVV